MFPTKNLTRSLMLVALTIGAFAQTSSPTNVQSETGKSESGAVAVYADSGWSFGLPAVRAAVSVPGVASAISPEKKTLAAPSFGLTVRAWKFIVPFADFTLYDTGKATASVGSLKAETEASTLSFNGGVRLVGGRSRLRPYAELGGGVVHQNLKATFSYAATSSSAAAGGSIGSVMFGGGMQLFAGRKWGSDIGFDAFHLSQPMNGAGQNYTRFRIGVFYQTKSRVQ